MVVGTHQIFLSIKVGIIVNAVYDIRVSRDLLSYLHSDTLSSDVNWICVSPLLCLKILLLAIVIVRS